MTALQMNAQIYQSLGVIAQDESVLNKVSKYLHRVANKMTAEDSSCMTKDEYLAMLDRAERQYERGEGCTFTNLDDMHAWLNTL